MNYTQRPEIVLGNLPEVDIPELQVTYRRESGNYLSDTISNSEQIAGFIRGLYNSGEIELQEQFMVLYLNQANRVIGYYKHSKGSINATVADTRIILGTALKCAAVAMIVAHNHPSGNLRPSRADEELTKRLKEGAALMDIRLLDHLIITREGYLSFADEGLLGLEGVAALRDKSDEFVAAVVASLKKSEHHNKTSMEKLAGRFGIFDQTKIKEFTELAIVQRARHLAHEPYTIHERYEDIVALYQSQVNLSHRTSQSILLQQYSTPAPIAFLAGVFCGIHQFDRSQKGFEPSAGNGMLTVAGNPETFEVNELDRVRNANLQKQGFSKVSSENATKIQCGRSFDAVLTNPPFGTLDVEVLFDTFPIKTLEHVMALKALDCMKDSGRAAIIIGGHTHWDEKGRIQAGKNRIFFNYLYSRYQVLDVINMNGKKLYSRQGTSFDTRLILIGGRKAVPGGAAPVHNPILDREISTFEDLYDRVMQSLNEVKPMKNKQALSLEQEALDLQMLFGEPDLGSPYEPASEACIVLNTQVPDSMAAETRKAMLDIKAEVGGDIDNFVRHRLNYPTKVSLCKVLSAEQIDAVAMAIYNIEARGQGMIIGDQTGIGKGRVAAAMIRYAVVQGHKPVFLTEKANLFSDIYRDLSAIGSAQFQPLIINNRESKTDIKDEDGNVVYQAPPVTEQARIMQDQSIPAKYDFVVATYSQFNSPEKKPEKPAFLKAIAPGNIFILDEAHNSSGSSNTGEFLQKVVADTRGVVFLSATFAKRPDNMPIYAMKTSIADCNMSKDDLVEAITRGGVALQEVLSSQLVAEGQMLRRERSFEGIEVNYLSMDQKGEEHRAVADNITDILRDIIAFQGAHVTKQIEELDKIAVAEGKEVEVREGTSQAGVDCQPYFSKVFQVINQMLFSLKAESVAEQAIMRLGEGKKPVIAFASTMGSFIESMENNMGLPVADGDTINADFSEVLKRGLDGILRYTEKDVDGNPIFKRFEVPDLPPEAQAEYYRILGKIKAAATGITISPIDVIVKRLKEAGYSVAEVTGRKYELQLNKKTGKGLILSRKKVNTNDAFRQFNNNEVDVLMINQSGSTGASAHAIPTAKVSKEQVRQRVMIVLQAELDINTEVQKRGRINRTGQILKPIYDYVTSAIPAEKRLMMMLQKKLKSLDANTASNQKQSSKILDVPDFLNKYGDKIVKDYLMENPEVNDLLDDPLHLKDSKSDSGSEGTVIEDAAHKVSGRVAVLSTKMQQDFYNEIAERYSDYVDYLRQVGEYDLEVEAMNLEAEVVASKVVKMGKGSDSAFGEDSILETVRAKVLKKPFTRTELENLVLESLKGMEAKARQEALIQEFTSFMESNLETEFAVIDEKYEELISEIEQEKSLIKIRDKQGPEAFQQACAERRKELNEAWQAKKEQTRRVLDNRKGYLLRIFRFFHIGRGLNYPIETYSGGNELVPALFLGFALDTKKKNPFAPSAIKVRFAIANSSKYLAIPASYSEDIMAIIGASADVAEHSLKVHLASWEEYTANNNVDRRIRHLITGNLLQAFSDFKGKLISFTTLSGDTRKGILMPENWNPTEQVADKVVIPIIKALPLIRSLSSHAQMVASNGLSFFRYGNYFKLIVSASRSRGGDIYLDRQLLELVERNNFEKVSDKMVAMLPADNLDRAVQVLQSNHSLSIVIHSYQLKDLKTDSRFSTRTKIVAPEPEAALDTQLLELEAEALILELQLLAA
jgi:hypothetical protein